MKEHKRIRQLRLEQNLTLQALADKVGTTKSQIDKLEKGERRLTTDWINRLSAALDVEPVIFFQETDNIIGIAADPLREPYVAAYGNDDLTEFSRYNQNIPVYGRVDALTGQLKQMQTVVDNVACPAPLHNVSGAYAVYVPDDSMSPRYHMGETLFLHPLKPLVADCYVLAIFKDNTAAIRRFIGRGQGIVLLQKADVVQEAVAVNELNSLHRVVGCWE